MVDREASGPRPQAMLPPVMAAFGWSAALWLPGYVGLAVAALLLLALPSFEQAPPQQPGAGAAARPSLGRVLGEVLRSREQWLIALGYLFISAVRAGIADWTPVLLAEAGRADAREAAGARGACAAATPIHHRMCDAPCCARAARFLVALDVGGCAGSIFAGYISDALCVRQSGGGSRVGETRR